jgi:hypothetical protein
MRDRVLGLAVMCGVAGVAHAAPVAPRGAAQLQVSLDGKDGDFAGMSHNGVLLVLKNASGEACTVPAYPDLEFLDEGKSRLGITRRVPLGMHPGPVMIPVAVDPGQTASATLRWVSGPVYDKSVCLTPAWLSVGFEDGKVTAKFEAGQLCGPDASLQKKVQYEATRMMAARSHAMPPGSASQ